MFLFDDKKALGKEADQIFAMDDPTTTGGGGRSDGVTESSRDDKHTRLSTSSASSLGKASMGTLSGADGDAISLKLLAEDSLSSGSNIEESRGGDGVLGGDAEEAATAMRRRQRTQLIPIITFSAGLLTGNYII